MSFPTVRMRRLRRNETLRRFVREIRLHPSDLVQPIFVKESGEDNQEVTSMPGVFQVLPESAVEQAVQAAKAGLGGVILFGIPDKKDPQGTGADAEDGVVQKATRMIKSEVPDLPLITDLCLCEYTDHGHCGLIVEKGGEQTVDNDATLLRLQATAVSQAAAGADIVAPSGMMDGAVLAIREALDEEEFEDVPIMSYAAKFASKLYGPFRDAAESPPGFGDRRSYQMDPSNAEEALREVSLDIEEGADIILCKPALGYLDVVRKVKDSFSTPVGAYNVSGEYSMVVAAAERGWLDEKALALELLTGMRRAGADFIVTYWAQRAAEWLQEA